MTVFNDVQSILTTNFKRSVDGLTATASYKVPPDAVQKQSSYFVKGTEWNVVVTAKLPGVDFLAEFEVPVFGSFEYSVTMVEEMRAADISTDVP